MNQHTRRAEEED